MIIKPINAEQGEISENMDEIRTQFKALAEVYDAGYAANVVWKHFEIVAKLLSVEIEPEK
jgi:hypothetical protein